jgi:hypothetical protein
MRKPNISRRMNPILVFSAAMIIIAIVLSFYVVQKTHVDTGREGFVLKVPLNICATGDVKKAMADVVNQVHSGFAGWVGGSFRAPILNDDGKGITCVVDVRIMGKDKPITVAVAVESIGWKVTSMPPPTAQQVKTKPSWTHFDVSSSFNAFRIS